MNNISVVNKKLCCGCGACLNICPKGAITTEESQDGFLYPAIIESLCSDCGLCKKACPVLNQKYENKEAPDCYAYMAEDEIRLNCSSGGVFYELALDFIKNSGYVSGVILDNNYGAVNIVSDKIDDIEKMRGSKYIQSDTKFCYREIKELLENNSKVFFTGTPCQIAGLKSYLQKDYPNLYCADIICHGVPSKKIFKQYIEEEILNEENEKWISTNFRDKSQDGWQKFCITTNTNKKSISYQQNDDLFLKVFLKDICLRTSCADCKFSKLPRQGDITIGDFWKIENYDYTLNDNIGTSVVLVNNEKGDVLLNILQKNAKLCKKVPLKYATEGNPNLVKSSVFHEKRQEFFENTDIKNLKEKVNKYLDDDNCDKCDTMILNFWFAVNYGAILTCYGVQCLLEKLGQKTKVINYVADSSQELKYKNSFSEHFAEKYLNLTTPCNDYKDFLNLNKSCKTFVTGSDQVFAPNLMKKHCQNTTESTYLLDFADSDKRKLSYAASFGDYSKFITYEEIQLFKLFLKQFDDISVRENEGVEIINKEYQLPATQLADGVFHIPKEKLEEMTANYSKAEKYLAYIELPYYDAAQEISIAKKISSKLNIPFKPIRFNPECSVEEWLAYIKNADFVVASSYHAILFAIIFNVPFIQLRTSNAQIRFDSLYKVLNIENNSVGQYQVLDFDKILAERNWKEINENIQKEIQKAEEWMKNALEKQPKDKSEYDDINFLNIKIQLNKLEYDKKIKLLAGKDDLKKCCLKYKILSKILMGKPRKKYKELYKKNKQLLKEIKNLAK